MRQHSYFVHILGSQFEEFIDANLAIEREKSLKHWKREWKLDLIAPKNPELKDLFKELAI